MRAFYDLAYPSQVAIQESLDLLRKERVRYRTPQGPYDWTFSDHHSPQVPGKGFCDMLKALREERATYLYRP